VVVPSGAPTGPAESALKMYIWKSGPAVFATNISPRTSVPVLTAMKVWVSVELLVPAFVGPGQFASSSAAFADAGPTASTPAPGAAIRISRRRLTLRPYPSPIAGCYRRSARQLDAALAGHAAQPGDDPVLPGRLLAVELRRPDCDRLPARIAREADLPRAS